MKVFWIVLNATLFLMLAAAAGAFIWVARQGGIPAVSQPLFGERSLSDAARSETPPGEPFDLPDSIRFRVKSNALIEGDATVVAPGEPFRFTLRPEIQVPPDTPASVQSYIEAKPDLGQEIEVEWKSESGGQLASLGEGRYEFNPPAEGGDVRIDFRGRLKIRTSRGDEASLSGTVSLQLICPIAWETLPAEIQERIGKYPVIGKGSSFAAYADFYKRPTHFYCVTDENEGWTISPNFALGDFDLKFEYTSPESPPLNQLPQYIALDLNLVAKLERILGGLQEAGIAVNSLGILAGYRSPAYNHWKKEQGGVGGKYTKGLSTHMYGCAADFFVDQDGDGVMDDLNKDGKIDQEDAQWVRENVVDAVDCEAQETKSGLAGMCGIYPEHDVPDRDPQTPNLHIDIRGYSINRWKINPRDDMTTQWDYWQKHTCETLETADTGQGESAE